MAHEPSYMIGVRTVLRRLEARCMGLETPVWVVLPRHLRSQPPQQQAEHLADQLLFALAKTCPDPALAEREGRCTALWLERLILYLLTQCAERDRTFLRLRSLITLNPVTRQILLEKHPTIYCEALTQDPPELLEHYGAAVIHVLSCTGQLAPAKELYETLCRIAQP